MAAPERQSSYFARNSGAAAGDGEWLVFIDADVTAPSDLIERYFEEPPGDRTGLLAGGILDAEVGDPTAVSRYLTESSSMSQDNTLRGDWPYAQTANCAVRRAAFEEIGGFNDGIRSGGDADLCFRLRAAGWELETRDEAAVDHHARSTLRAMVRQRARHGSGSAWLNQHLPRLVSRRALARPDQVDGDRAGPLGRAPAPRGPPRRGAGGGRAGLGLGAAARPSAAQPGRRPGLLRRLRWQSTSVSVIIRAKDEAD